MMADPSSTYRGWAPCAHTDDAREELKKSYLIPNVTIEDLIVQINMMGPSVSIAVDQWWGVEASTLEWADKLSRTPIFRTYIQGDTLLLALTETYRQWLAKIEEIGEPIEDYLFNQGDEQ